MTIKDFAIIYIVPQIFNSEKKTKGAHIKNISPSSTVSSPEIILNKVDFPQPDGPTKTINSPS